LNGVAISWASSDEGIISNEGLITRQQYGSKVTLTATLAFGKAVAVKEFTVTVPDFFKNIDDAIKVHNAKEALKIPAETDCDLDLPVTRDGVAISWASSDEDVISNDGIVTRQLYDTQATLTATLAFGSETAVKEFTVTVLALGAEDPDTAKVAATKEALAIPAETDRDLDLPLVLNGVAISWASSDEWVISDDGIVTRQLYDVQAKLTATLTLGSVVETKEFTVTVLSFSALEIDAATVAAAKEVLAIPAETDCDLDLPVTKDGVTVSWASSDEGVISNGGHVTRQLYDVQAVLMATLILGSAVEAKEFTVTVLAVVEEEAELVEFGFQNLPLSVNLRHRVTMIYSDENAVFYCRADNGVLRANSTSIFPLNNITKNVCVLSGEYFYWHDTEVEDGKILYDVDHAFIEIVVKLEETIIGYTVIEVYDGMPPYYVFSADILKSVIFPQINGEYQKVSEKYVQTAIEKVKTEAIGD